MNADRSTWPEEAVALAEWWGLADHGVYFRAVKHPNEDAYADVIQSPRVRYGDTEQWVPVRIHSQGRQWVFAQKIPRKPPRDLDCKLSTEMDATDPVSA